MSLATGVGLNFPTDEKQNISFDSNAKNISEVTSFPV
jgi:hypothetical protein